MSPLQKLTMVIVLMCVQASAHADCVVLLHGLARTSKAMDKLASELAELDYKIANVDYPSREKPIEELSPLVVLEGIRQCQTPETEKIHFVTHSMGGILIRYYLESNKIDNLGHVVMIAPPNQGSEVVDMLSGVPGYALVNGPAGQQLGTDPNSIPSNMGPVDYSVGVIAGNKTFNPLLSQFLPNPDDGKVSVESTKVEGMADFVVVNASHPFIMEDDEVIGYTLSFLKSGSFGVSAP
jgi:triacylglycerol lipase